MASGLPPSTVALQAIWEHFSRQSDSDWQDDALLLLSKAGFCNFILACPALVAPPLFTLEKALELFDDAREDPSRSGLTLSEFIDSLVQVAVERYPSDDGGIAYATLLAMNVFRIPNISFSANIAYVEPSGGNGNHHRSSAPTTPLRAGGGGGYYPTPVLDMDDSLASYGAAPASRKSSYSHAGRSPLGGRTAGEPTPSGFAPPRTTMRSTLNSAIPHSAAGNGRYNYTFSTGPARRRSAVSALDASDTAAHSRAVRDATAGTAAAAAEGSGDRGRINGLASPQRRGSGVSAGQQKNLGGGGADELLREEPTTTALPAGTTERLRSLMCKTIAHFVVSRERDALRTAFEVWWERARTRKAAQESAHLRKQLAASRISGLLRSRRLRNLQRAFAAWAAGRQGSAPAVATTAVSAATETVASQTSALPSAHPILGSAKAPSPASRRPLSLSGCCAAVARLLLWFVVLSGSLSGLYAGVLQRPDLAVDAAESLLALSPLVHEWTGLHVDGGCIALRGGALPLCRAGEGQGRFSGGQPAAAAVAVEDAAKGEETFAAAVAAATAAAERDAEAEAAAASATAAAQQLSEEVVITSEGGVEEAVAPCLDEWGCDALVAT